MRILPEYLLDLGAAPGDLLLSGVSVVQDGGGGEHVLSLLHPPRRIIKEEDEALLLIMLGLESIL